MCFCYAVDQYKNKWKTTRDYYRKQREKLKKAKSGSKGGKVKAWPLFDSMIFMDQCMEMRP